MSSLLTGIDLSNIPDAPAKDAPGAVVEPLAGLDLSIIPDAPTPAAGLKDAWASTEGTKPDDAATALNHWANTGADPGATLADPKAMEAARQPYIDFERLRREAPAAAAWLSQPENMAVARDDIENLAGMDKGVQAGRESVIGRAYDWISGYVPGMSLKALSPQSPYAAGQLEKDFFGGVVGVAASTAGGLDWLLTSRSWVHDAVALTGVLGLVQQSIDHAFIRDLGGSLRDEAQALMPEDPGFLDQLASGTGSAAAFFIPSIGITGIASLAASVSLKAAPWLAVGFSTIFEAFSEGGNVWQEMRARGHSDEDSDRAAGTAFIFNLPLIAITNKLGVFGDAVSGKLKTILSGALEGLQELGQGWISADVMGDDLTVKDALTTLAVGSIIGVGMGAVTGSMKSFQVAQAERADAQLSQAAIKAVVDTVRSSPLRNRSIEALKAYASFVAQKNGLPEYMYLPAEEVQALFQESTPEAQGLMDALGVAREDVERSLADGSDVRFLFEALPAAEALPAFERMAPLMRFRPKSVIAEELAEIEQAAAEDQRPLAAAVELDRIEAEILSAGFSKRDARDTRLLYEFQSRVWADSMGRDASEVLKRVDFKRVVMTDEQAKQLSQMRAKGQKGARALREMGLLDANDPRVLFDQDAGLPLVRTKPAPKKTVKAYKLFRVDKKQPGGLFPLFVNASYPVVFDTWLDAQAGEQVGGKVKSKLGPLAFRPGWHAGETPVATHIGLKTNRTDSAPSVRNPNYVWAEVELSADVDWQVEANRRARKTKSGRVDAKTAQITDQVPEDGYYKYKTNPNMTGAWLIGGSMKVNRVLSDVEVQALNNEAGTADLSRAEPFNFSEWGFDESGRPALGTSQTLYQLSTGSELEDFGFYSAVRRAVEAVDFKAMPAADLAARIAKTAGIKAEELEDLGLLDWLAGTDGKVTKEQVLDFIAEGGPNGRLFYDKQTKGPRGAIFWQNSHAMIRLFETADVSTLVHETAHFFKEIMRESAADPGSPTRIQADFEEIERFVGVAKGAPWNRAQEERFAQAFEAYIMEGRAPSPELRSVFERFRQWFVQIYRTVKSLKVELTPEVRGVFDRLLATDAEITVARAEVEGNEIFAMVEGQDDALTPQERQAYNQLRDRAHSAAAAEITARRAKELRGQEREWRADAKDLADSHPHHQAVDEIVRRGGIPRAVLAKDYDEATIKQLARLRVGLITKEGKVYPDEAAEIAGLGTADDFIEALLRLPTKREMVEDYVAQATAEYERGLASDAALTDEHIEMLELEARAIEAMTPRKQKVVSTPDLKKVIRRETGQVRTGGPKGLISEATALKAAMRKAARYAREAYRAGKLEEAADWKEKQRRNALRLREVQNARRLQQKLKGYFKRIVKAKASLLVKSGLDWLYLEQIRAVVGRYGTVSGRYQAREGTPSLRDFLAAREEEGDRPYVEDWIVDDTSNRKLKDLRVDELEDLWASLRSLEAVGRDAKKVVLAGRKVSLEQASAELSGAIRKEFGEKKYDKAMLNRKAKGAGWKDSFTDWLEKAWAFPLKAEFLCRAADGFKSGGPVREAIYMRIKKASDRSYEIQEKLNKGFEAIWKPIPARVRAAWRRKNIFVPGLPAMVFEGQTIPWTRERLLMAAVYTGQAEGVQRMEAYGINADHVQLIRETLTDKEWGLVREHWRLNEEHVSKEYAEAYEQETGVPLKLVERLDLTVRGRTFKGGYFKLQYDGALDRQAKKWQAQKEALNQPYMPHSGKVAAGSTKSRAGKVGRPLLLSFDAVGRQFAEHIHYATHNIAVRDVRKLLNDKGVRLSLETAIGPSGLAELDEWLTEVANPRRELITPFEQIMGGLRRNSTVVMLGLKMSVTLLQFSGLTISAKEVGVGRLAQGMAEFVSGPVKAARFVWSRDPEMRARWKNLDREISDFSKWLDPTKSKIEKGKEFAFAPIAGADMLVSIPTWLGAYRGELAASGNEAKAIEAGGSAVRTTQGFGPLKDRAAAQRGGELRKLFFMFYTAMNTIGNQTQETLWAARRGKLGPVGIARNLFFLMLFPAVLEMVIRNGELPEDPEAALAAVMDFVLGQVPVIRDWAPAGVAIWQRLRGRDVEWYKTEVNLSPVVDAYQIAARIMAYGAAVVSGDADEIPPGRLAKDVVKAAGYAAGLPASQINTTAEGAWQLLTGESDELRRLLVKGD